MCASVPWEVSSIHQLQCLHHVCYQGEIEKLFLIWNSMIQLKSSNFCNSAQTSYNLMIRKMVQVVVLDRFAILYQKQYFTSSLKCFRFSSLLWQTNHSVNSYSILLSTLFQRWIQGNKVQSNFEITIGFNPKIQ